MPHISNLSSFRPHRWSFRPLFRRRQTPALPVELWEQILDYVLYIPFVLDTAFVRPQDFYSFIMSRLIENAHPFAHDQLEDERRIILRLVCRSWNAILSRESKRRVIVYLPNGLSILKGAKRVHIGGLYGKAEMFPWENARSASIISYTGLEEYASDKERDLSILFEQAANLQAIRSFIYNGNQSPLPLSALQSFETSFGTLTSLILTCSRLSGTLRLPNLTILYLDAYIDFMDIEQWWFPSLRHIAFGVDAMVGRYNPQLHRPFIPGPMDKLQSLLLPDSPYAALDANDSFWTSHPSLQFLGLFSWQFTFLSDPPSDHPLSHIHFLRTRVDLHVDQVMDIALRIPNLQTITTLDRIKPKYAREWHDLYWTCRQKGIRWFDANGEEICLRKRGWKTSFQELEWWEQIMFTIGVALVSIWCYGLGFGRIVASLRNLIM